jgi:hypothetical protein
VNPDPEAQIGASYSFAKAEAPGWPPIMDKTRAQGQAPARRAIGGTGHTPGADE